MECWSSLFLQQMRSTRIVVISAQFGHDRRAGRRMSLISQQPDQITPLHRRPLLADSRPSSTFSVRLLRVPLRALGGMPRSGRNRPIGDIGFADNNGRSATQSGRCENRLVNHLGLRSPSPQTGGVGRCPRADPDREPLRSAQAQLQGPFAHRLGGNGCLPQANRRPALRSAGPLSPGSWSQHGGFDRGGLKRCS